MSNVRTNKIAQDNEPTVSGLALITVNDPEQGFSPGAALWNVLEAQYSNQICRFEISRKASLLGDCLAGHSTALIVDSTSNGTKCGTVSLVDLSVSNKGEMRLEIPSNHGKLIAGELKRFRKNGNLPERLLLLGVEGPPQDAQAKTVSSTVAEYVPLSTASLILSTLLETLRTKFAS